MTGNKKIPSIKWFYKIKEILETGRKYSMRFYKEIIWERLNKVVELKKLPYYNSKTGLSTKIYQEKLSKSKPLWVLQNKDK